jgi:Ser/Thr protein kinase RdoA (MazF antagonist)
VLTAADRAVVERDRALPGLATLLDSEEFLAVLRPYLPDLEIQSARRTYLRYKPRVNCLAAFELETSKETLRVYGKAYGSDAPVKLAKGRIRRQSRSPLGAGHIVLEDRAIVVSAFPNDSKLPGLSRLAGSESARNLLESVFRGGCRATEIRTIQYKPERRYVARLEADGTAVAALKIYTPGGYREARRPAVGFSPGEVLRVPRLLGKSDRIGAIGTSWMPGRPLSQVLCEPELDPAKLTAVGAALAELHAQEPKGLPSRLLEAEIASLRALARFVAFLVPDLAARAWALARRFTSLLRKTPASWNAIHGDFYAKQVLLDGARVVLLDLDAGSRGDGAADLGLFIAHLERDALRGMLAPGSVEPLTRAFLEGYSLATPRRAPVELYTSLGLFRLLHHPFRHCEPSWIAGTEAILARAEQLVPEEVSSLARARPPLPPPRVRVTDRFGVASDPRMPFLRDALDPGAIRHRLQSHVFPDRAFRLYAARVTRHKPARRCVIEYELQIENSGGSFGALTLVGKARGRGLDLRAYESAQALQQAGLGPASRSGTSVPEPFGTIPVWRMWLQRKVSGVSATELLAHPGSARLARRVAEAIHELHEAKLPSSRRHTMEDELRILHERLPRVAAEFPQWEKRVERLLEASDRLGASIPTARRVGIHRDFYSDHVIVDEDRLYLIDLDLYCEGDPALDIGNFSGHLIEYGLRMFGDPRRFESEQAELVERFLELSGEELRSSIRAYTVLTLVRHIHISTQLPKRRPFTERLLELSEQLLLGRARA